MSLKELVVSTFLLVFPPISASGLAAPGNTSTTAGQNTVVYAMRGEPPQLNSLKTSDVESGFILGHVMEGLTRYGKANDGSVVPGVAERWAVSDTEATFHLRKDARWSDGSPVTAQDFVFAWRTALRPETGSQYAFVLYPIKNAEAIAQGKLPATELGARAVDDRTLKVALERPNGYFLSLTAFPTYFPVKESFYRERKDRYASEASEMLFNGPYRLTRWIHGSALTLERNPTYWNPKLARIARIEIPYLTPDNSAKFNLFKDRKIDLLNSLGKDDLPKAQKENYRVLSHLDGGVHFLEFNLRPGRPTANRSLRKAIQLALADRSEYISKVVAIPGTRPAYSLIPSSVRGAKKGFLQEHPVRYPKADSAQARKLVEQAKKELGGAIPPLTWLVNDNPLKDREAQYMQQLLRSRLGLEIRIDKQILKQRLAKMNAGEFDVADTNWSPDYPDPMTYAELKASWSRTNRGRWENAEYDQLIREAQSTSDNLKRMAALAKANQILTEEAAVIPTYESMVLWMTTDRLEGVIRRSFGPDPDFTHARIAR